MGNKKQLDRILQFSKFILEVHENLGNFQLWELIDVESECSWHDKDINEDPYQLSYDNFVLDILRVKVEPKTRLLSCINVTHTTVFREKGSIFTTVVPLRIFKSGFIMINGHGKNTHLSWFDLEKDYEYLVNGRWSPCHKTVGGK